MLDNLTQRLAKVMKTLRGEARLTESNIQDALREVRMALLEADVALPVVRDFIATVREKALGEEVIGSLTPGQALVGVVHRELTALMGGTVPEPGTYALMLLHDRDGNRKLTMSTDGIGFPNNPRLGWSKPKVGKVSAQVSFGITELHILMNYNKGFYTFRPLKERD